MSTLDELLCLKTTISSMCGHISCRDELVARFSAPPSYSGFITDADMFYAVARLLVTAFRRVSKVEQHATFY